MKKVICSGYAMINIIQDEFEGNEYKKLEIQVDDDTIERTSLKSASSYKLLQKTFEEQARRNKQ